MTGMESKQPTRPAKRGIPPRLQRAKEYGIAVGATLLAFFLRLSLDAYLEDHLAYIAFLVAIAVTTWYGGIGPSVVAVVLGGLIANWVFVPPRYTLSVTGLVEQAGIIIYLTVSFALVGVAQTWRWAWKRTEDMTSELRTELDRHRGAEEVLTHVGSTEGTSTSKREHRV